MNSPVRWLLAGLLVLNVILPMLLLAVLSAGGSWFFPALLPDGLDTSVWRTTLSGGGRLLRAGTTSVTLGFLTALLATAIGVPAGRALSRLHGWRLHLGTAAAFLPVAAPPVAVATGLHVLILQTGLAGTAAGVLLAHLVPTAGYLTIYFLGVFAVWDDAIEEEARSIGATRMQTLRHVTLPLLRPAILTSMMLGFLISWAQVPLTLVIGAGAVVTLPLEVFAYAGSGQDRYAAAGALLLTLPPVLLLAAARRALPRTDLLPV